MSSALAAASQYRSISDEAETVECPKPADDGTQFLIPRKAVAKSRPVVVDATATHDYDERQTAAPSKRPTRTGRHNGFQTWRLEIVCCVLFFATFFAVVATVYPYSGKKPPRWKYGLTLNTFVAAEVVILKASMLLVVAQGLGQLKWSWFGRERSLHDLATYDNASRGPWGAVMLLFKLRGRQFVSSIGASVTLAALIIDPFAQQLISTQDCDVIVLHTNATISRSNYFSESAYTGADGSSASLPLQAAVNAGIYAPGGTVAFECATGNCTFGQLYSAMGYCGGCVDLTTNLTVANITFPTNTDPNGTSVYETAVNISLLSIQGTGDATTSTSVSPGGPNSTVFALNSYLDDTSDGSTTDIVAAFLLPDAPACGANLGTIEDAQINLTWACSNPGLSVPADSKNSQPAVGAARCFLSPCVRTYTAGIVDGTLNEQLVNMAGYNDFGTSATMFDVQCLSRDEMAGLTDVGYDLHGQSWVPNNITTPNNAFDFSTANISISPDCIYGFAPVATQNLDLFLTSWLKGQLVYADPVTRTGPAVLQAIYNSENLTFNRLNETWRNLSDSITNYMREHGAGESGTGFSYSAPALGEVHTVQTCIRIQWLFIIYPAVLVVLALVFFIAVLVQTNHDRMDLDWKSSLLALLFHGLDCETVTHTDEQSSLLRTRDMEDVAKEMVVRLGPGDGGWKLVRVRKDVEMHHARHRRPSL